MKSRIFIALALFLAPLPSQANFWEICGDILRVGSAYARVPTDLILKFWNRVTSPTQVSVRKFNRSVMKEATERYSAMLKSGETNITFYNVLEADAGFLNALIDTPFDVENILKASSEKKKSFYGVLKKITDGKPHTIQELEYFGASLYEAVYSDAIISNKLVKDGLSDASKFLFLKVWEERAATQNLVKNFKDLGLIHNGTRFRRFKDFMHDPLVETIIDVGLNYGLLIHSPVIYAKAPNKKFTSWMKFSDEVKQKIMIGDYEGAWNALTPIQKLKINADVFYQAARYGVNSVMPYLTAASIAYLIYDRWEGWKEENPNRDTDIPPFDAWPKPRKKQLRGVVDSIPNLTPEDREATYKNFGI